MSNRIPSKQNLKMKSQPQSKNKNTNITSSSVSFKSTKNVPATDRTSSLSKDEEKTNSLSIKTGVNLTSRQRTLNRGTLQKLDAKSSTSRSREITLSTPRTKPRQVIDKRTQLSRNKQVSYGAKDTVVAKPVSSKPNRAMNTVHNVTVSSPPSKRKEKPIQTIIQREEPRLRSKSRTLSPEEIIILKGTTDNSNGELNTNMAVLPLKVKESVAFDVVFDQNQITIQNDDKLKNSKSQFSSDQTDYDDDFESYESDFETGSSSEVISEFSSSSKSTSMDDRENRPNVSETDTEYKSSEEGEEESEVTHIPITVIHREKEFERKLDSGNYDLNSNRCGGKESFDSFNTMANSDELDSGISYEKNISAFPLEAGSVSYGGFSQFHNLPKITNRGAEIMSKIQFDSISFTLLDLKPFPYDTYMKLFGNSYTMQCATQTVKNCMEIECQTDEDELRSVWTQYPIEGSYEIAQCTGELLNYVKDDKVVCDDIFENTIKDLSKFRQKTPSFEIDYHHHKPINYERLNSFLNSSSSIISRILKRNSEGLVLKYTDLPNQSKGFLELNTRLLNALRVVHVFANAKFNLILTVHESIENVYHTDFSNLIMVWNCENFAKPLRLLSTWSEVSRAEICNDFSEIIVCGLRDGSVAMWDLRETYSFCSKVDGHLTHFAATHTVAPSWGGAGMRSFDFGAVVDVKSFPTTSKSFTCGDKFKTVQFASLNETGLLAIWTLVETNTKNYEICQISDSKFEYSSPWARVKLIQSAICDLREYIEIKTLRPKSAFERTKSNFQKDVFNDDILKELAESQSDMKLGVQGLRFINLDCGTELIFVGTNRNFIISCSKTLKKERFRKINIVGSGFLFPTAIKLLQNEDFLAVGLSNGSVMLLNCNQEETYKNLPLKNLRRKDTIQSKSNKFDYEIGKSCAIQNLIRSERRSLVSNLVEDELRPNTSEFISATLEEGKKPYELRIFDEQILLSGSVLRKDLIQNLELSSDGWFLFALSDGNVRIYDFCMETEVPFYGNSALNRNIIGVAGSRHGNERNIILLDEDNKVQIHLLK